MSALRIFKRAMNYGKRRGAEFLTEPIAKYGEIRCYIRDPDGYLIEVGQSTDLTHA
jgi:catechol 2,3-dioxygenase-like lactoylglutathione lyase family enzyme